MIFRLGLIVMEVTGCRPISDDRSPEQFDRLISAVKSGHISVPLHALINCYGGMPTEAAIRGMYYAGQIERKYNLRFRMAGTMENNTLPLGMSSIWAGSGAKYSWNGIGGYGSQMSYEYRANRRHQLYRYTGLDGASVIMKWYMYDEKKGLLWEIMQNYVPP